MTWQGQHGGHIAHLHVDLLRQQFAQIRAVCDLRKARRKEKVTLNLLRRNHEIRFEPTSGSAHEWLSGRW
jgi:hypothetical protein